MDDLREVIARAIAKADRVEICSDASYRHSAYGGKADAALAAIKQAGFVVVPAEPTEAMVDAGARVTWWGSDGETEWEESVPTGVEGQIYRAMIEASNV